MYLLSGFFRNFELVANCSLFDTSMKFGTSIAVTNTSFFRYSAKLDVHWFPWKQQFIKIHEFPLFISQFIGKYFHFNASNLFTKFELVALRLRVAMETKN